MISKRYLGVSVYAEMVEDMIKLTTENGRIDDPSNTIYLEPEVMVQLKKFEEDAVAAVKEVSDD